MSQETELTLQELLDEIKTQIKRIGWSKQDVRNFLRKHYQKQAVLALSDEQIQEFCTYLACSPVEGIFEKRNKIRTLELKKIVVR